MSRRKKQNPISGIVALILTIFVIVGVIGMFRRFYESDKNPSEEPVYKITFDETHIIF